MHFAKRRGLVYLCTWLKYIFDRQINKGIFFKEKKPTEWKEFAIQHQYVFCFVCLFIFVGFYFLIMCV